MSFTEIDKRVTVNPTGSGVTVSFRPGRHGGKPVCIIGMRATFLAASGFGDAETFRIAVGRDDDHGKIRVWPSPSGAFTGRKAHGARILDLGHLAAFGAREHKARLAVVEMVDGAAVVTLPDVDDDDDAAPGSDDVDDEAAVIEQAPAPPGKVTAEADRTLPAKRLGAGKVETHNGVTVCLADGLESVSFKGLCVDVSPRGARLVELLAKAMPDCIDDAFLADKLWTTKPAGWTTSLDMICTDLKSLKTIGLEVRTQRGIGRQLRVLP